MSKTRTLIVAGIAFTAMALSTLGGATTASAAPLDAGDSPEMTTSESTPAPKPRLPACKRPDCYYA